MIVVPWSCDNVITFPEFAAGIPDVFGIVPGATLRFSELLTIIVAPWCGCTMVDFLWFFKQINTTNAIEAARAKQLPMIIAGILI